VNENGEVAREASNGWWVRLWGKWSGILKFSSGDKVFMADFCEWGNVFAIVLMWLVDFVLVVAKEVYLSSGYVM